jgi:hypothetical protein
MEEDLDDDERPVWLEKKGKEKEGKKEGVRRGKIMVKIRQETLVEWPWA